MRELRRGDVPSPREVLQWAVLPRGEDGRLVGHVRPADGGDEPERSRRHRLRPPLLQPRPRESLSIRGSVGGKASLAEYAR